MCTRFVYHGNDIITGFNFDIDLSVWNHRVIEEKERFYIGILRPDGTYHSYHGVNQNGNVGTLLYVHGNPAGVYQDSPNCMTIADLTEQFIKAQISFDDVLRIVKTKKITYAPDSTMQAMLSDAHGRILVIDPGIGYREEHCNYWITMKTIFRFPTHLHFFMLSGRREHGLPEFLLFTLRKNRPCIMRKTINLTISKNLYFHSQERRNYDRNDFVREPKDFEKNNELNI